MMDDHGHATLGAPLPGPDAAAEWRADWEAHAQRQRDRLRTTTPAQRLAWLEEALAFAARVGTLRAPRSVEVVLEGEPRAPG